MKKPPSHNEDDAATEVGTPDAPRQLILDELAKAEEWARATKWPGQAADITLTGRLYALAQELSDDPAVDAEDWRTALCHALFAELNRRYRDGSAAARGVLCMTHLELAHRRRMGMCR